MDPKIECAIIFFSGYIMGIIDEKLIMRLVNKQKENTKKE